MNKDFLVQTLLVILCVFGLFGLNFAIAQDDDEDEDGGVSIGDLSNSYDFQKLGGMASRLAPYGDDLMGDLIDKNAGGITFEHMDVSIPGNSSLKVALRRKINQGNHAYTPYQQGFSKWVIDLPIAYTAYAPHSSTPDPTFNGGCLINYGSMHRDNTLSPSGGDLQWPQFTSGVTLHIPGKGLSGFQADPKTPQDPKTNWVSAPNTTDHAGRCATLVIAPDGTKYKFGRHVTRASDAFRAPYWTSYNASDYGSIYNQAQGWLNRKYAVMLITEVEDINGNWVRYEYTNDARAELTRIHSNDGREIDVYYDSASVPTTPARNSRRVSHVTANGRTWNYDYASDFYLHKVTLPDGRYWELGNSTTGMNKMFAVPHDGYKCLPWDHTFSVKHPDGAIGTFRILETRHIKGAADLGSTDDDWDHYVEAMNIPFANNNSQCYGIGIYQRPIGWPIYRAMSVASKTISGTDIPTATWNFTYRNYSGGALDQNWTTITGPEGTQRTYNHQAVGIDHGLLTHVDVSPASGGGETISYAHNVTEPADLGCKAGGNYGDSSGMCHAYKKRPVTLVTQQRDGDTYTIENTYNQNSVGAFIDFGFPNKQKRYSSISGSTTPRETVTTYEHKTSINVVGLPKRVVQNGRELATFAYDSLGRKISQTRYGQHSAIFTYHTHSLYKGALSTATDALGRQVYRTNYKRGIPQSIRRPDNLWLYITVDNNGWMTSSTDAMSQSTTYTRDNMGRLTLLNPPGSWANTSIAYNFSGGGGAVQTITTGQFRETITYDEMYRPILERSQALDTGWSSYVNTNYYPTGQVKFKSQPSTSQNETKGVDFTYDGLGRVYQVRENVAPYATTKHRYYSSNRHRIHDPSGAWTDYYSYGYGGPGNTDYRAIYKYANGAYQQYTYLYENVHGQMTRLRQWGSSNGYSVDKSQYFYYGTDQRVCRHYVPEQGATKYQYDAAGQVVAYAKGQSNSGCGTIPASSSKVDQSYDVLGRPTITNFSHAGTPDISRTYDANSNVKTVYRGGVNWTYNYNDINLPTHEYLDVDGRSYDLAYYYNNSGHLNRKILPSGRNVYVTPDGLGRPRTIVNNSSSLASNISYHANGSLSAMSYGNGQNFTQTLNARLLPDRMLSHKGTQFGIDQTYGYDARGKVTSITDSAVGGNNRSYSYDGLGRLTTATGPWGPGSYTYDALGNLRQKVLGSRSVNLSYNSLNQLTQSADTGSGGTRSVGYDSRGNVTTLGGLTFVYDYSDQPVSISGSASGTYTYDGNFKRVKTEVSGKTIYNIYSASGKLVHVDAYVDATNENQKTDYVQGAGMTIARISNNSPTYFHPDHLGSAVAATTSSGAVAWREKYTPFGEKLINNNANDDLDGFTGHIDDSATGLTYMQARYYDPAIGRFLSIDPVGFVASNPHTFNRYAYVGNNPANLVDPTGETGCVATGGVGNHECDYTDVDDQPADNQTKHQNADAADEAGVYTQERLQSLYADAAGVAEFTAKGIEFTFESYLGVKVFSAAGAGSVIVFRTLGRSNFRKTSLS